MYINLLVFTTFTPYTNLFHILVNFITLLRCFHFKLFIQLLSDENIKKVTVPVVTMATIENGVRRASQVSLKNFIPEILPLLERSKNRRKSTTDI